MTSVHPPIQFNPVPEMTTCTQAVVNWSYLDTFSQFSSMSLFITNSGVDQTAPPSSSSSSSSAALTTSPASSIDSSSSPASASTSASAIRQGQPPSLRRRQFDGFGGSWLPPVKLELGTGLDPTTDGFTWASVNVPQGWYMLQADLVLTGTDGTAFTYLSDEFFVQNVTTTCLTPSPSSSTSPPASTATAASASDSPTAVVGAASSSHSHTGAIVGGVLGSLAFLFALAAAAVFFLFRRRQRRSGWNPSRRAQGPDARPSAKHRGTDSMQRFAHAVASSDDSLASGGGGLGVEKVAFDAPAVLPAVRRGSGGGGVQPESYGMRARAPSHSSASSPPVSPSPISPMYSRTGFYASTTEHTQPSIPPSPSPSPPASTEGGVSGTAERSQAQGRRKPVPKYDAGEFPVEQHVTADALRHQNSFGSLRAMHVLMPDMPMPARGE